jgi:hypothetical protein
VWKVFVETRERAMEMWKDDILGKGGKDGYTANGKTYFVTLATLETTSLADSLHEKYIW